MPLEPTDPWSWLRLAQSDLAYAIQTPKEALFEPSAFLAEQPAEKALKALLVDKGVPFPKTHNLDYLLELLESTGLPIPEAIKEATLLMEYTLRGRYPAGLPELTREEWEEALALARRVVAWVEALLSQGHG